MTRTAVAYLRASKDGNRTSEPRRRYGERYRVDSVNDSDHEAAEITSTFKAGVCDRIEATAINSPGRAPSLSLHTGQQLGRSWRCLLPAETDRAGGAGHEAASSRPGRRTRLGSRQIDLGMPASPTSRTCVLLVWEGWGTGFS